MNYADRFTLLFTYGLLVVVKGFCELYLMIYSVYFGCEDGPLILAYLLMRVHN